MKNAEKPNLLDEEEYEFQRLYGPWEPVGLSGAADLMSGFKALWWIVGGYALEAFSGVARSHTDCDVAVFAKDVNALRNHFAGRFHLWTAGSGVLRPLNDHYPQLPDWASQIWLREHALAPWRMDLILNPNVEGYWQSKRDASHVADLNEVTWVDEQGIRFLNPEICLLHKAKHSRSKDKADLEAT